MKRDLLGMSEKSYDATIVGGGIYGVCLARELALQGLSVALLERDDFGGATSANSLKIIHGGLRYPQNLDLKRMRESIGERRALSYLAPHLVRPMSFVIPCYGHFLRGREVMFVALLLNDLISYDRNKNLLPDRRLPHGRVLTKKRCEELVPELPEAGLNGGAIWYDGQAQNTERLTLSFLQAAVEVGADAANHAEVTGFLEEDNRVAGVQVTDRLDGATHEIRSKVVVNAAGPWVDSVLGKLSLARPTRHFHMSKGMNLVTRQVFADYAVAIPYQEDYEDKQAVFDKGKLHFFILPWRGYSLIGTRHLPWDGAPDTFRVTEEDVQTFLAEIQRAYPHANLTRADVLRVYEGMLPALSDGDGKDVQIGKQYTITDHAESDGFEGLVTLLGVKWTTVRDVAERAARVVLAKLQREASINSADVPLPAGRIDDWGAWVGKLKNLADGRWNDALVERLAETHGAQADRVLERAIDQPNLGEILEGGSPTLVAELQIAVQDEMARSLVDVVLRRTELAIAGDPGGSVLKQAGQIVADELGWSEKKRDEEIGAVLEALHKHDPVATPVFADAGT